MRQPAESCSHSPQTSTHPVDTLMAEHEVILAVLEAMEKEADALRKGASFAREKWARYPEFLRNFADRCHHGKEEDLLFPAMVERGVPDAGGPIGVMKSEHVEGRALVTKLAEAIQRGESRAAAAAANEFAALLKDHIAKENGVLFPMGKQILEPAIVERLVAGFARAEAEIMGPGTHCKYVELAQAICADAGVEFAKARGTSFSGGCCGHHSM